ncbi:hypothetical protein GCM10011495_38920 [Hymenobacter frigidus]|uniref:Outer membrane protein beta-barrel domain-containing protein n=1 Tax=Hymenobacter frigidus TaxID=1524095 RepID=A0ABQ2AIV9_9BACT|nr:hypothetical protein [Hymenobacter frigidus]GGH91245.1 hypothetical protein GCM10011495_38920 [Hymenobacter frigidus]
MSTNPIDQNATPKPTGNLEELFRHHLGEEAAVPPRPMLWDQIDNSLLIRQNETYRRRLAATRWVAAASLLLASLAGTGWWVGRDALLTSNGVAGVASPAATRTGADDAATAPAGAGRRTTGATNSANAAAVATNAATGHQGAATSRMPGANAVAATKIAANTDGRTTGFGPVPAPQNLEGRYSPAARYGGSRRFQTAPVTAAAATASGLSITSRATQVASTPNSDSSGEALGHREQLTAVAAASATSGSVATSVATGGVVGSSATTGLAATAPTLAAAAAAPTTSALAVEPVGALAARATSLALADAELLPTGLVSEPVPTEAAAAIDAHRWHYSTSYMAGVFNPNINFSRTGIEPANDYDRSAAFGANSPSLTESAATEYRNNLRPGLSQRLAVLATRHLKGHWSLSTGIELSQATAKSASASSFVGEQLFDLGQSARPLQTTNFRYRLASVPAELRYSNPVKHGWSLYGRLGGVVSALLGVRSEVTGNSEATRTYSIVAAGTPYRRVLASVRGGAGAQFRAGTGKWALSAGPVVDLGLVSLNAHPAQSYLAQSHPYTIGVEAAIEFGR